MSFVTNAGKATAEQTSFDPSTAPPLTATNVQDAIEQVLAQISKNIDGGSPESVYLATQVVDGGAP